jgi:hypothetical protein
MKKLLVLAFAMVFLIPLARTAFAAPAAKVIPSNMRRLSLAVSHSTKLSRIFPMSVTASGWGDATSWAALRSIEINESS